MGKYLKLFETHSQYEAYVVGGEYLRPNVSHCISEDDVHYTVPIDWSREYFTIESLEDNNTIYLKASNTSVTKTISASTDNGKTWQEYTSTNTGSGTTLATLNGGDKLLIKGQNETYGTTYYNQFRSTGQFEAKGNIMSLISGDSFTNADELTTSYTFNRLFYGCSGLTSAENLVLPATTLADYCYRYMFVNCASLITAPDLPATTLASYCYDYMFSGCTSLTTAPELPATTLADDCYRSMFAGCTGLTTAPELPATALTNSCYNYMFSGCTSLTTAPELPATTLAYYCYRSMFAGCTGLTTAPDLPATTLAEDCYGGMFLNCVSLTTAPELPATTLADNCYGYMFYNCTGLTTAPDLPATTLANNCYECMFQRCTSLNYIKAMFTTAPGGSYTYAWVTGVASTGTFVKNASATWTTTGSNGVPAGWTVQTASA